MINGPDINNITDPPKARDDEDTEEDIDHFNLAQNNTGLIYLSDQGYFLQGKTYKRIYMCGLGFVWLSLPSE